MVVPDAGAMPNNHKLVCARAARREFAQAFKGAIKDYRQARHYASTCACFQSRVKSDSLPLIPLSFLADPELAQFAWDGNVLCKNSRHAESDTHFRVMARKRPLQNQELKAGEYDSVSIEGRNNAVVVHDGRVHRDGRTLYTVHSRFCLDRIFSEVEENITVYREAAAPLVEAALDGRRATLVFFGQTGTGKTYTASAVLDILATKLFEEVPAVSLLCYELAGTRGGREAVFDLLAERAQVKCLTGEDGQVHIHGARHAKCETTEDLRQALKEALSWRTSESTERNEASSRSHAILELRLHGKKGAVGSLRVVDLAGSERNFETLLHTRSMAERGGHINYSLLMLKECARIMHRNERIKSGTGLGKEQHIPFRASRLTHLLQSCFVDKDHRTVVVATLSPAPTDIEHSLNTLQHVGMMRTGRRRDPADKSAQKTERGEGGFGKVEGRGRNLHSKLQDARAAQLKLHSFNMVTVVGGSIQKKYDMESLKTEAFIDPRYHREMQVEVEEDDVWVLRDADAEVTQVLTAWREEQWQARKAHDLTRWDAVTLQSFVASLDLPGQVRIPSTMTGAQLRRLGPRGLSALCSDERTAEALSNALLNERTANHESETHHKHANAKITALGKHQVHAALSDASTLTPGLESESA